MAGNNRNVWPELSGRNVAAAIAIVAGGLSVAACETRSLTRPGTTIGTPAPTAVQPSGTNNPRVGFDISHDKCKTPTSEEVVPLPSGRSFTIIGLNGGLPNNANPCREAQTKWAEGASGASSLPKVSFYVNTANPGPSNPQVHDWPKTGKNELGICDGSNSAACAYEYGKNMATADLKLIPESAPSNAVIWMDVEKGNDWGDSALSNRASLVGMAEVFKGARHAVGIYGHPDQVGSITGPIQPESGLYKMDYWIAQAPGPEGAKSLCLAQAPTAGRVVMAQFESGGFDADLACR